MPNEGIGFALEIPQQTLDKLNKADKLLTSLADSADNAEKRIVAAFRNMTSGVDPFLKKLNETNAVLQNIASSTAATGMKNFSDAMSDTTDSSKDLSSAVLSVDTALGRMGTHTKNIAELKKEIKEVSKAIEKMPGKKNLNEQQQLVEMRRMLREELKIQESFSAKGALSTAKAATTYNQRAAAIKNLEQAIKNLDSTDSNYTANLNKLSAEYKKLQSEQKKVENNYRTMQGTQRKLINYSEQLIRRLALAFSISQISGYVKNLARVRGEFELQNKALAAIMQNKDEADKLFGQITELAVKSPFQLKELVTYTKELAAYRVENEKLYDTTKMLADVSAGLGVDMSRLILAYGQVKAANYLRGCLGYGTPILLFNGKIKQVQDIVVGDVLINEKGEPVNVLELIRGRETMFLIEQISGHDRISYRVNRNHILTLWNVQEQRLEDVYLYDYLKNQEAYLGIRVVDKKRIYYDIKVTEDRIDDYYGFVLDGNKRFRLGDGTITHNTELRQFSEAGINILGELAKYFSELEGRAISVGEVFERVSNRMVTFADVETIFKRITSAGGIFFNMQEIQANTLAGMISNMRDSIDIMFNEIGTSTESQLKGAVATVKNLVDNWREVVQIMKEMGIIITPIITYMTLAKLASSQWGQALINNIKNLKTFSLSLASINAGVKTNIRTTTLWKNAMTGLSNVAKGLTVTLAAAVPTALLMGILELWRAATKASREAKVLKKNLDGIISSDVSSLDKLVTGYENLATRLKMTNKGSKEHKEIISQLNANYGQYLDFIVNEQTSVEDLTKSYDSLVSKMREKAALSTYEKGIQQIDESYGDRLEEARNNLEEILKTQLTVKGGIFPKRFVPELDEVAYLINKINTEVASIEERDIDSTTEAYTLVKKILQEYYGVAVDISDVNNDIYKYTALLIERKKEEKKLQADINAMYKEQLSSRDAQIKLEEAQLNRDTRIKDVYNLTGLSEYEVNKKIQEINRDYELERIQIQFDFGLISESEKQRQQNAIKNWANDFTLSLNKAIKESLSGFTEEDIAKVEIGKTEQDTGISEIIKTTTDNYNAQVAIIRQQISLKNQGLKIDENILANAIKNEKLWGARAKALGLELDYLEMIDEEMKKSINAQLPDKYQIDMADEYRSVNDLLQETKKELDEARAKEERLQNQKKQGVTISEEELNNTKETIKWLEIRWKLLGGAEKQSSGGRKNEALEQLKLQIDLIKEAGRSYEKLLENYSPTDAADKVREAFERSFKEAKIGSLLEIMDFDKGGLVTAIRGLLNQAGQEGVLAIEKATDDLSAQIDIEIRVKETKDIQEQIDALFDRYQLTINLDEIGIDQETMKNLFDTDALSLDDLEKSLDIYKDRLFALGNDGVAIYKKAQKEIAQERRKELEQQVKEYVQYLKMTKDKRIEIEEEARKKIAEIEKLNFTRAQKDTARQNIEKEARQQIAEIDYEELKGLDIYRQSFEDLERLGTSTIEIILTELEDFAEKSGQALDVSSFRELTNNIKNLRDEIEKRNPFKSLISGINEYREAIKEIPTAQKAFESATLRKEAAQEQESQAAKEMQSAQEQYDNSAEEDREVALQALISAQINYGIAAEESAEADKDLANASKNLTDAENKKRNALVKVQQSVETTKNSYDEITGAINETINAVKEIAEGLGLAFNEETEAALNGITKGFSVMSSILSVVLTTVIAVTTAGYAMQAALWPLLIIGAALAATFALISAEDAKGQSMIDAEQKRIEKLQKAYEDLRESFDNALSFQSLQKSNEELIKNIKDQIAAYDRMIAAEKDKKSSDIEQIEEWQKEQEDLLQQAREQEEAFTESLGGLGSDENIKSATEDFVDAWFDAFMETGDGLSGLEDSFEDFFNNIIKKQLLLRLSDKFMKPFFEDIDAMLNAYADTGIYDQSQIDYIRQLYEKMAQGFNEQAEQWMEILGIQGGMGADTLSELQKGIQGITETQAASLEALLNSMRFSAFNRENKLNEIYSYLTGDDMIKNPLVAELKAQTILLNGIASIMSSITKSGHPQGGFGVKIFMD